MLSCTVMRLEVHSVQKEQNTNNVREEKQRTSHRTQGKKKGKEVLKKKELEKRRRPDLREKSNRGR